MDQHDLPKAPKARRAYTGAAPLLLKPETARAVLRDVARAAYRERREARILGDEARLTFALRFVEERADDYPGAEPGFASYEWAPVAELLRVDGTHAPGLVTRAIMATVRRAHEGATAEGARRLCAMMTGSFAVTCAVLRLPHQEERVRPWYVEADGCAPVAFVLDAKGKVWVGVLAATPCPSCHGPRTWDHRAQGARCAQCEAPAYANLPVDQWPDAECSACFARYWSGEGHPKIAICPACWAEAKNTPTLAPAVLPDNYWKAAVAVAAEPGAGIELVTDPTDERHLVTYRADPCTAVQDKSDAKAPAEQGEETAAYGAPETSRSAGNGGGKSTGTRGSAEGGSKAPHRANAANEGPGAPYAQEVCAECDPTEPTEASLPKSRDARTIQTKARFLLVLEALAQLVTGEPAGPGWSSYGDSAALTPLLGCAEWGAGSIRALLGALSAATRARLADAAPWPLFTCHDAEAWQEVGREHWRALTRRAWALCGGPVDFGQHAWWRTVAALAVLGEAAETGRGAARGQQAAQWVRVEATVQPWGHTWRAVAFEQETGVSVWQAIGDAEQLVRQARSVVGAFRRAELHEDALSSEATRRGMRGAVEETCEGYAWDLPDAGALRIVPQPMLAGERSTPAVMHTGAWLAWLRVAMLGALALAALALTGCVRDAEPERAAPGGSFLFTLPFALPALCMILPAAVATVRNLRRPSALRRLQRPAWEALAPKPLTAPREPSVGRQLAAALCAAVLVVVAGAGLAVALAALTGCTAEVRIDAQGERADASAPGLQRPEAPLDVCSALDCDDGDPCTADRCRSLADARHTGAPAGCDHAQLAGCP